MRRALAGLGFLAILVACLPVIRHHHRVEVELVGLTIPSASPTEMPTPRPPPPPPRPTATPTPSPTAGPTPVDVLDAIEEKVERLREAVEP